MLSCLQINPHYEDILRITEFDCPFGPGPEPPEPPIGNGWATESGGRWNTESLGNWLLENQPVTTPKWETETGDDWLTESGDNWILE